jgi:hypothetical protein
MKRTVIFHASFRSDKGDYSRMSLEEFVPEATDDMIKIEYYKWLNEKMKELIDKHGKVITLSINLIM